jgi:hypothetical protein
MTIDDQLASLWAAGKSMSEIAEALGGGESRNVVAGKIARSRGRGEDLAARPPRVVEHRRMPPTPLPSPVAVPAPGPKPRLLIDLHWNGCRTPVGEAPDGASLDVWSTTDGKRAVLQRLHSARQRFADFGFASRRRPASMKSRMTNPPDRRCAFASKAARALSPLRPSDVHIWQPARREQASNSVLRINVGRRTNNDFVDCARCKVTRHIERAVRSSFDVGG